MSSAFTKHIKLNILIILMKILSKNLKQGEILIQITSLEDLWHLSHVLEEGDIISGKTERKLKIGEEPNIKTIRKKVFLEINVEKVEFEPDNNSLRLLGTISKGPDDISLGSYHSFSLSERDEIKIKKNWPKYLLNRLEEATKPKSKGLIVLFDREDAIIAELKQSEQKILTTLKGDVAKKNYDTTSSNFYKEIKAVIEEYFNQKDYEFLILASPAFWSEYLMKEIPDELKSKVVTCSVSSVNESSLKEVFKSKEVERKLKDFKSFKEVNIIDKIMKAIHENKACYGLKDSEEKANIGSISEIAVTNNFIKKNKEEYKRIDSLLKKVDEMQGEVHIIDQEVSMKKLDSLGGIAGILRWGV